MTTFVIRTKDGRYYTGAKLINNGTPVLTVSPRFSSLISHAIEYQNEIQAKVDLDFLKSKYPENRASVFVVAV